MFLQHNINGVMYRKEEAGDSLNNKLERQYRTEFVSNYVMVEGGGTVIAAFFWPIIK